MLDARWMDDENFAKGPAQFFDAVPQQARDGVMAKARLRVAGNLKADSMGIFGQNAGDRFGRSNPGR